MQGLGFRVNWLPVWYWVVYRRNLRPQKRETKPDLVNIGALIVRIGFGAHYTIITIRSPQNGIGNY